MSDGTVIAVIGLGEAGSAIAADLVAVGATVRGWDPVAAAPLGVELARDERDAAAGADAVLSLNSASVAKEVAEALAPGLEVGQLLADLNTTAPSVKLELAEVAADADFADVALMAPVLGRGIRTPALASGPGAGRFAELFGPLGMPVTALGGDPGEAAGRKLAQSVFTKGLAAAIGEALAAGEKLGCEPWLYDQIERTLTGADGALLRRLIDGSRLHAGRRVAEMAAAAEMLEQLGVTPRVAAASEAWLRSLAARELDEHQPTASG
jgi:3-hydroxyisobutyrate dehydrogenase-like beta-hydroxyacid dehydrogenase